VCGGIAGVVCTAGYYCDFAENDCGAGGRPGDLPAPAERLSDPVSEDVCGCDGQIYSIPCDAYAAGTGRRTCGGLCGAERERLPCGDRYCVEGATYCQIVVSDVGGVPNALPMRDLADDLRGPWATPLAAASPPSRAAPRCEERRPIGSSSPVLADEPPRSPRRHRRPRRLSPQREAGADRPPPAPRFPALSGAWSGGVDDSPYGPARAALFVGPEGWAR
jgi:hypothetical protein